MAFPFNHRKEVINMKKSDRQKLLLHEKNLYKAFAILAISSILCRTTFAKASTFSAENFVTLA